MTHVERRRKQFALGLRNYMLKIGISGNSMAELLGLSPQYLSRILGGSITLSLKAMCHIQDSITGEDFADWLKLDLEEPLAKELSDEALLKELRVRGLSLEISKKA